MIPGRYPASVTDAELLKLVASGTDQYALPSLMARHKWIKGVLYNITHSHEDVEDAWQDARIKVIESTKHNSHLKIDNFEKWLYRTAVNLVLMKKRKDKKLRHDDAAMILAENIGMEYYNMSLEEDDAEIMLRSLAPHAREVVRKRIIEGKSIKETADELHISQGTVKSTCNRGLAKLKQNKRL